MENLVNSIKIHLNLFLTKLNLVGHTFFQELELQYKCQKAWFE
jgi:hypothetical protein